MKSTPQFISKKTNQQSFPITDWNYHSAVESTRAAARQTASATPADRPFWELTRQVLGPKTTADLVRDLVAFVAMAALSAWPIVTAAVAITRLVRNY